MSNHGRFYDAIHWGMEAQDEETQAPFFEQAWNIAFEFGKQIGLEQAGDDLEREQARSQAARSVALVLNDFLASDVGGWGHISEAVETWRQAFIETGD